MQPRLEDVAIAISPRGELAAENVPFLDDLDATSRFDEIFRCSKTRWSSAND